MSGSFEAKNYMYRKNKDGIIVGLVVHPNDVDAAFAALPIGARVMIAWAAIGDDEKPIEAPLIAEDAKGIPREDWAPSNLKPAGMSKPKRQFSDYPLSAQCAMTCDDPMFHVFLEHHTQESPIATGDEAAFFVRKLCGVKSRAELDKFPEAANAWRELYQHYQAYITDSKYAAVRR